MSIVPIGGTAAPTAVRNQRGAGGSGFRVLTEGSAGTQRTASVANVMNMSGLLCLQDVDPPQERDRRARRQGEGMLAALARLQRALLGEDGQAAALDELANLAASPELAANMALRETVAAIRLRAAVELARAETGARRNQG